jgi:hypothetical protein
MGRPPIGKVAMTSTERSRRSRVKQRAGQQALVALQAFDNGLMAEFVTAVARIRELEVEVAAWKAENARLLDRLRTPR